ncbi:hypothetical protein [Streptomyces olivoreticuli]|uniref:hypothetical protein n=1 Tax=Streptomyces olivoreticuli TaxID=68246 RepID=UPI000E265A87|nr:hypothetical protein [Streptomyces olivoreticuli]
MLGFISRWFARVRAPFVPGTPGRDQRADDATPVAPSASTPDVPSAYRSRPPQGTTGETYLWVTAHGIDLKPHHQPTAPQGVPVIGMFVIDTVTGGAGKVTAVDGNGMISIQHPNGHAWRSCTVRPADRVERLNLLAADALAAQRTIQWSDD